jgi:threonine synthase
MRKGYLVHAKGLVCRECKTTYPLENLYNCAQCKGPLEVIYDYDRIKPIISSMFGRRQTNIWKYAELLPIKETSCMISLGEGGTPLIKACNIAQRLGMSNLFMKLESHNPTGSFKDRPTSVAVSKAIEEKANTIVIASSGNAGASAAAYAARAGLKCIVYVPEKTPTNKIEQTLSYGAEVIKIAGTYSNSFRAALESSERPRWVNVTSTFLNPYTVEGDKTVAYEIWEQMGKNVPDWVVIPIGAGPLLVGVYKGFTELAALGLASKLPRMIGVQAKSCAPIVDAFNKGSKTVEAWLQKIDTVATGIADPLIGYPQDGTITLSTIRKSAGLAIAVDDEDILDAGRRLAKEEGIFAEPTSAASLASVQKLVNEGIISTTDTVIVVITGNGLKTPNSLL